MGKELRVRRYSLKKRMNEWLKTDPAFANFHYLGKHRPTITLDEFAEMKERVSANPLEVKSHICSDLNEKRTAIGKKPVAKTIFEIQTAFIIECTDLLIDELIHRRGRIQQLRSVLIKLF